MFGPPSNPYVPELDLDDEDPEEDPEEEEDEDQVMADPGEPERPEPSEDELLLQRWGRFRASVEAWGPIPDETIEDYESRFFATFFDMKDFPEGLEDADLCRIFWQGVPEPIAIRGTSRVDSLDAQLDNARQEWRIWQERIQRRPSQIVTASVIKGRRRPTGVASSSAPSTIIAVHERSMS